MVVRVVADDPDATPSPVDVVLRDETLLDVHHLDEVHLLAVRR
jgi:hypothetical protein